MQRVIHIEAIGAQRDRWVRGYRWATSQPGWVVRLALVTFLLVVVIPFAVLLLLAFVAAAVVGGALAFGHAAISGIRGLFQGDGRANVRVIRRDDGPHGS